MPRLSGDHCRFGDQQEAKGVFDIDSAQPISMAKQMRDDRKLLFRVAPYPRPRFIVMERRIACGPCRMREHEQATFSTRSRRLDIHSAQI